MWHSIWIAIALVVALMVTWLFVQLAWRKLFADQVTDEDVLAGRRSCGQCGCAGACTNRLSNTKNREAWHA